MRAHWHTTWRIRLNVSFVRPTGVHNPYDKSIGSAIFGRLFVKRFTLCYRTVVCPVCLSVCDVGLLSPNGWMDEDETWHGGRTRPWPHCVRWGLSFSPKGHIPPFQILAHVCCGQTAGWIKMPLGTAVGLGPDDIVLDGDPAVPKMGHSTPTFWPMSVVAKQQVGWLEFNVPFQHK